MTSGNRLRFIRNVLYRLKRDYGLPADFYHQSSETVDLTTGKKEVTKEKCSVKRAILLPKTVKNDFVYALSFIAANKNFTYGGFFGTHIRELVVDRRDLGNFTLDDHDNIYIIIDGTRYEITEYVALDQKAGYHLKIKATEGAQLAQIVEPSLRDRISVSDTTGSTP